MDPRQFLEKVIRPSLDIMHMGGAAAEQLMLGTALTESGLRWLRQIEGPALGVYQMEPATHDDIWENWLGSQPTTIRRVHMWSVTTLPGEVVWNLYYATIMARLVYRRRPEPLPPEGDGKALALYHKAHYNTPAGKTDPSQSVIHFERAIAIVRGAS